MAAGGLGRAELLLQLPGPHLGGGIGATEQPLAIGIIEAGTQPQAPRYGAAARQGGLGIEQVTHQAPGTNGGGLIQGTLQNGFALLHRQLLKEGHGAAQPVGTDSAGDGVPEQQLASRFAEATGFQMTSQHLHRGASHHAAILPTTDGQGELAQASIAAGGEPMEGEGSPAVIECGGGRPPLQQEPLHSARPGPGPEAIEHGERSMGRTAREQHLRVGEHHGQGLGRGTHHHEPFLQLPKTGGIVLLEDLGAGLVELIEVVLLEQGSKGGFAQGRRRSGGSSRRGSWGVGRGAVAREALGLGSPGRRGALQGARGASLPLGLSHGAAWHQRQHRQSKPEAHPHTPRHLLHLRSPRRQPLRQPHGGSHGGDRWGGEWQGGHKRGCAPPNLSAEVHAEPPLQPPLQQPPPRRSLPVGGIPQPFHPLPLPPDGVTGPCL